MTFLESLNKAQYKAVTTTEGPLLVIAGAGSGKTRVLTSRVAYILKQKLAKPYNLLVVTFTNKAAREMKARITSLLGKEINSLQVSTFHSFCALLLRREAQVIGIPSNFTIFDEDDAQSMIKNCLDQLDLPRSQFTPRSQRRKISTIKNQMLDASEFSKKASGYFESKTAQIYELYEQRMSECGALDFDDLIFRAVQLLESHEDVQNRYQDRFNYILVDEYQDTNHSQYRLLKLLIGSSKNICVVGDEDQSIYGWRGADISNILNFEKDFPGAKTIKLEQNYRSTDVILKAASAVISNNINRKEKTLWTDITKGDPIKLFLTDTAYDEASAVVNEITQNMNNRSLNETVILYRTNAQSRAFEELLHRNSIAYQIIGGTSFYQRKEIKDLIAYLKLLANPRDDISFQRIINYPRRGIGETSLAKLRIFAAQKKTSMYHSIQNIENCDELGQRPKILLRKFFDQIEPFFEKKESSDIATLANLLVDELKLSEYLIEEDPQLGSARVENINELIAAASEFSSSSLEPTLDNFLVEISLYTDLDSYREIEDKLSLMTLHSAKGLEFEAVFMVGLEEGLFPLGQATEDQKELEEERRLFYVGATRAKRNLYISMAVSRGRYGNMESIPSRFIKELPPALVDANDQRNYKRMNSKSTSITSTSRQSDSSTQTGFQYEYEEEEVLHIGRIVQHPSFGRGKVIKVEGSGEALRLEIHFTGIGIKKIMPKYASLKIVG